MITIPQIGKTYKFYDDGKASREYDAIVTKIVSKDDAKTIMFKAYLDEDNELSTYYDNELDNEYTFEKSLFDIWRDEVKNTDWLLAENTDYLIECSIPDYDKYPIWFVRTRTNDWFSLNIQSDWQGGLLDTDGMMVKRINYKYKQKCSQVTLF
jgi:hypothetical protein